MGKLLRLARESKAATAVEYGLIIALIFLGGQVSTILSKVGTSV